MSVRGIRRWTGGDGQRLSVAARARPAICGEDATGAAARKDVLPADPWPGGPQTFKPVLSTPPLGLPHPRIHEGYDWLYVPSGGLRLVLGAAT